MLQRIKQQLNRATPAECSCGARNRAAKEGVEDMAMLAERLGREYGVSFSCECGLDTTGMFAFVFTKDRCTRKAVQDENSRLYYEYHTKPLRKVWRRTSFRAAGWSSHNTLILEDTPQNCVDNYGNALYIRTFDVMDTRKTDSALLILQAFLDRLRDVANVRTVEKRQWERLCASAAPRPAPLRHAKSAPSGIGIALYNNTSSSAPQVQQEQSEEPYIPSTINTSSSNASLASSSSASSSSSSSQFASSNRSSYQQFIAPYASNWPWSGVSKTQTGSSVTTASSSSNVSRQTSGSQRYGSMVRLLDADEIPVHIAKDSSSSHSSSLSVASTGSSSGSSGRPALLKHSATSESLMTTHSSSSTLRSGTFHGKSSQPAIDELEETDSDLEDSYQRWGSGHQHEEEEDEYDHRFNQRYGSSTNTKRNLKEEEDYDDDDEEDYESDSSSSQSDAEEEEDDHPLVATATGAAALAPSASKTSVSSERSLDHRRHVFAGGSSTFGNGAFGSYDSERSDVLEVCDYRHEDEYDLHSMDGASSFTYTTSEGDDRLKQLSGSSLPHPLISKRSRDVAEERLDAGELLAQQLLKVRSLTAPNSLRPSVFSSASASSEHEEDHDDAEAQDFNDDDSVASYDDSGDILDEYNRSDFDLHCCSVAPATAMAHRAASPVVASKSINIGASSVSPLGKHLDEDLTSLSAPHSFSHRMPSRLPSLERIKTPTNPVLSQSPSGSSASAVSPWASAESAHQIVDLLPGQHSTGKNDASEEVFM